MKTSAFLPLLALSSAFASPLFDEQTSLNVLVSPSGLLGTVTHAAAGVFEKITKNTKAHVEKWAEEGRQFVKQDGLVCKFFFGD